MPSSFPFPDLRGRKKEAGMFQRFHEMRESREDGFTLIELLVVVLIIAILAAIAIPFFLNQRERSFESQAQSALKNAATAMESHATDNNGDYPLVTDEAALVTQGYRATDGVAVDIVVTGNSYCLTATHDNLDDTWEYEAAVGAPVEGDCS
jgi:type IV pilus assembly protein PilA